MKKKNAIYYNAIGVGDFSRLIMATSMSTMKDSSEARGIDKNYVNVLSYIKSLKAPKYSYIIDNQLVTQGKIVFEKTCSSCHGTYGSNETYPNLLIDTKAIGTDPVLADSYAAYPEFENWYNKSWFSTGSNFAKLIHTSGYIAPPLDGVWATAPYFHNASVPNLESVLNSKNRPTFWRRAFDNKDYDQTKMGWNYETLTKKEDTKTYNTTLRGYGNTGHYYGDGLSDTDRKALLEYLKTL
jgi:Cytochrome c